MTEFS